MLAKPKACEEVRKELQMRLDLANIHVPKDSSWSAVAFAHRTKHPE